MAVSPDAKLVAAAVDNLVREVRKLSTIAAAVAEQLNRLEPKSNKEKTDDRPEAQRESGSEEA